MSTQPTLDTTFTTAAGVLLTASFSDETEAAARADLGLDLAALARLRPAQFIDRFKERLRRRDGSMFGLLTLAVYPQLQARGIEAEQFAGSIRPEHLGAALRALMSAIATRHPLTKLAKHLAIAARQGA